MINKIICSGCGAEISAGSKFCSKCGARQSGSENQTLKKTNKDVTEKTKLETVKVTEGQMNIVNGALGILAVLFILAAFGVSGSSHSTNTVPNERVTDYYDFTTDYYSSISTVAGYIHFAPEDRVYVVVTLHMNNTGTKTYSTLPSYWELHTGAGGNYKVDDLTSSASGIVSKVIAVPPGTEVTTQMIYNIPKGSGELRLKYTGTDHE